MLPITFILLLVTNVATALTYKGVDWSSLLVEENAGIKYSNAAGTGQSLETILKANGVNTVRQRLWTAGTYNLDYNLKLAQRAKAAGLKIYLDFHFSDSWADPGHQTTPSAWRNYDIDDLAYALYNYTKDTMNRFQSAGIPLSLVSIGNEITAGMLWPLGARSKAYNLARLLHSASSGIKDSNIGAKPRILIHLDNGWNYNTQQSWYDAILAEGPLTKNDFDVQAVSYYPFYNSQASLANIRSSLKSMRSKYGKDVMVVETNWPQKCTKPSSSFPSDTTSIPFSAAGQTTWIKDVAGAVGGAGGSGMFYWEPAWLNNPSLGSSCENNLMFDGSGKALSSVAAFGSI